VREGIDVRGGKIPPINGLDFDLIQGNGTKLSADKNTLTALLDGTATMKRFNRRVFTATGERIVPSEIEVTVKPVIKINADEIDELVSEDSIEIQGKLKKGAKVTTKGELYLDGDIEGGATIIAGSLVVINGEIHKSEVSSDSSIITSSGAKNTMITAGKDIEMRGIAENSKVVGQNVSVGGARGSRIVAGKRAFLGFAQSDEHGTKSKIGVGYQEFYENKLEATLKEITSLEASFDKVEEIFGREIVAKMNGANLQQMMIQYLRNRRQIVEETPDKKKIDYIRRLMETIVPLKELLKDKQIETKQLRKKLKLTHDDEPVLVIREKITDPVDITIDGETFNINQDEIE
ncbi:MAG: FapA family protein, partial [bacterium]